MKTYKEMVQHIAERAFDDALGGGHGRINTGLVSVVFEKDDSVVYDDAKEVLEKLFQKNAERWAND